MIAIALLAVLQAPLERSEPARVLEVRSKGYSRFEIEGDEIVAFYPEAVEFRYLGYEVSAGSLRYNHLTEVAVASGGVVAHCDDYAIKSKEISFDGRNGMVMAESGVEAELTSEAVTLTARQAELAFPGGSESVGIEDVILTVEGEVSVSDPKGSVLCCELASYDGSSAHLTIPGDFVAMIPAKYAEPGEEAESDRPLLLEGRRLVASISTEGICEDLDFADGRIRSGASWLCAQNVRVVITGEESSQTITCELDGSPTGSVNGEGTAYTFSAGGVTGVVEEHGFSRVMLQSEVEIWSSDAHLICDSARITRDEGQVRIDQVDGVLAETNLAEISGSELVELGKIGDLND